MNTSKNNWLLWAVIILIVANVALLSTIWFLHHRQTHHDSPAEFLAKELKLDDNQKEQLHHLANEHHMQAEKIQLEIKDARDNFFKLLQQPNVSDSMKKSSAAQIADKLQQLELLTFDHFQQVRNICNPEQQKKFDEIIQDVLKMVAGPPPAEDHNHPPDDHMPPPER